LVVADCVDVAPFGVTTVKTTPAPEAGIPPLVTVAAIGTVPGREKLKPETATLADNTGGATTVALAVSLVLAEELEAVRFTA